MFTSLHQNVSMRDCTKCLVSKSEDDFSIRSKASGRKHTWCKECVCFYRKQHFKSNRSSTLRKNKLNKVLKIQSYYERLFLYFKEHPCVDCGETDPIFLEFDHVRGKKITEVMGLVSKAYSWNKIQTEIEKCEVRCCKCHRLVTVKRGNHLRSKWISGTVV